MNLRNKIEELMLRRDFYKFNSKAEALQRKIDAAEQKRKYYEVRADEVIKSANRLKHGGPDKKFGFSES